MKWWFTVFNVNAGNIWMAKKSEAWLMDARIHDQKTTYTRDFCLLERLPLSFFMEPSWLKSAISSTQESHTVPNFLITSQPRKTQEQVKNLQGILPSIFLSQLFSAQVLHDLRYLRIPQDLFLLGAPLQRMFFKWVGTLGSPVHFQHPCGHLWMSSADLLHRYETNILLVLF